MKSQSFGHACAFFDSPRDESRSALPWLARGLAGGERLLFFVEPDKQDYWRAAFAGFAIDSPVLEEKGSIVFHGQLSDEPGHEFNSLRTASSLWSVIEQSLPGYAGLRLLIDMQWTQDTGLPADKLCHWEATLEYLLSDVAT
ncbi:MAG TPA: MEDS domain-containing protein, partial [Dehalococcoidia bacterium]|nr:MEDS domain-containing protein [Dehalococcoidia bacterium]